MVEQDYVMRIIHQMIRALLRLIFHKDIDEEILKEGIRFENMRTAGNFEGLKNMADRGEINEAENLLYEEIEAGNQEDLKMALLFYDHLNTKSNEFLEGSGFSREEVADGMKQIIKMYGYEGLADTLLEEM